MTDKPHNNFFISVFSEKRHVVELITQLLPTLNSEINVDSLELDSTSYVDESLDSLYSDIVYNCQDRSGSEIKITLLFEHKSNPVKYPRFQLLDYILSIWRRNLKNGNALTLVIPIIFYHGKSKWKYRTLASYFKNIECVTNRLSV